MLYYSSCLILKWDQYEMQLVTVVGQFLLTRCCVILNMIGIALLYLGFRPALLTGQWQSIAAFL